MRTATCIAAVVACSLLVSARGTSGSQSPTTQPAEAGVREQSPADAALVDAILERQADPNAPWSFVKDGDKVVSLREEGRVTDEQWLTFLANAVDLQMNVRPQVV
ncbi:MAG: hypothetical protein AAF561_08930, partial [Planctomycetota bacterium]